MEKHLIIIGAGGNLGKGASEILLQKNYNKCYLVDSREIELKTKNLSYTYIKCGDLTIEKNVEDVFSNFNSNKDIELFLFSTIGGYSGGKTLWEITSDEFEKRIKVNLFSNFLIGKQFSILAQKSAGSSICFTSAMSSFRKETGKGVYAISKSALNFYVEVLALEGKQINMSANAISPNILDTAENRSWVNDLSLMTSPEQIGEFVHNIFLNYQTVTGNIFKMPFSISQSVNNMKIP